MATREQAIEAYRPRLDFESTGLIPFLVEHTPYQAGELRKFLEEHEPFITKAICEGYRVTIEGLGTFSPTVDADGGIAWRFDVEAAEVEIDIELQPPGTFSLNDGHDMNE